MFTYFKNHIFKRHTAISIILPLIFFTDAASFAQIRSDKLFFFYEVAPSTDFKEIAGESEVNRHYEILLGSPPIDITPKLKWINSVYARSTNYNFQDLPKAFAFLSSELYDVQYASIFILELKNPKWSILASPRFIWRGDFEGNDIGESFFFSSLLLANYNPDGHEKLTWSFGLVLTNDFNRNLIIPIVGFIYNDEKFTVEVSYPRVNLLYKPKAALEWGITASIIGGIYKTANQELVNGHVAEYTRTIDVLIGHTFNYFITKQLILNTCIGYMPLRNYDLMNGEFEAIQTVTTDLSPSIFFRTGLSMRF